MTINEMDSEGRIKVEFDQVVYFTRSEQLRNLQELDKDEEQTSSGSLEALSSISSAGGGDEYFLVFYDPSVKS